uniref:Uncharacterized protein n=1 Tax=Candidatus Kentrum sp. FW TaxID=2126338 RepID=A0A450TEE7_9GAMM|nr:MAG: hypothetical protein BECKFW1821C_GA0114237_100761 [Candidatus Kentron sp. FW]
MMGGNPSQPEPKIRVLMAPVISSEGRNLGIRVYPARFLPSLEMTGMVVPNKAVMVATRCKEKLNGG